jgi:hypothetical protein
MKSAWKIAETSMSIRASTGGGDYAYQACLETLDGLGRQLPAWIEHYSRQAPHSALGMQAPAEFYAEW